MIDIDNLDMATIQRIMNVAPLLLGILVLATTAILIWGVRTSKREARRHAEVMALLTEIRNKLAESNKSQ